MAPIGATGGGAKYGKQARCESGPRFSAVQCTARSAETRYLMRLASRPTASRVGPRRHGHWSVVTAAVAEHHVES